VAEGPDGSTVRKLTRRLGPELVDDLIREVIGLAIRERGLRVRAMRCDSTVQEADVRYPTDAGLDADAVRLLARAADKVHKMIPELTRMVRNRSRAAGKRVRTLGRRTGDAKQEVQRLTEEIAELAKASMGQAKRLLTEAQRAVDKAGSRMSRRITRAVAELEEMITLSGKVVEQTRQRFAGEKIADRLVSLHDPDSRPIRKGKKSNPTQFGYMNQYAELSANTRRGAHGLLPPPTVGSRQRTRGQAAAGDRGRDREAASSSPTSSSWPA
jgi:IS5 family transposase